MHWHTFCTIEFSVILCCCWIINDIQCKNCVFDYQFLSSINITAINNNTEKQIKTSSTPFLQTFYIVNHPYILYHLRLPYIHITLYHSYIHITLYHITALLSEPAGLLGNRFPRILCSVIGCARTPADRFPSPSHLLYQSKSSMIAPILPATFPSQSA